MATTIFRACVSFRECKHLQAEGLVLGSNNVAFRVPVLSAGWVLLVPSQHPLVPQVPGWTFFAEVLGDGPSPTKNYAESLNISLIAL